MGLDVRVYKNVQLTDNEDSYDFKCYVGNKDWVYKVKNLVIGGYYNGECSETPLSYSYSTHNRFREELIKVLLRHDLLDEKGKIMWSKLPKDLPFLDFIDFSDCEGCLDWEVSEKIYNDFKRFHNDAKYLISDEYHLSFYEKWLDIFERAKDNGVVVFY